MFYILCLLFLSCLRSQNLPDYDHNYLMLTKMSWQQSISLITFSWHLPKMVNSNPAVSAWIHDQEDTLLILWCPRKAWKPPCQYSMYRAIDLLSPWSQSMNSKAHWKKSVQYDDFRYGHVIEDARIYSVQRSLYIAYSVKIKNQYFQHSSPLKYNKTTDNLYLDFPTNKVLPRAEEFGAPKNEKNWSPFVYRRHHASLADHYLSDKVLFVYSIVPHRIVITTAATSDPGHASAETVCLTEIVNDVTSIFPPTFTKVKQYSFWSWGEPRGGTQTELVDTVYGKKYLTFFHSNGKILHPAITTYFMGAYIFDSSPPFAISHVTIDPLLPNALYNDTAGWAYKAVDYIVYPIGYVVRNDTVYLSVGKNDNSGWIVALNLTALVVSMKPVGSKTVLNKL